jgi:hypothetical protein
LAAALLLGAAPGRSEQIAEQVAEQIRVSTPEQAQYRDSPKGLFSCAMCTLFMPPAACKVVTGTISPTGWCKFFDLAD